MTWILAYACYFGYQGLMALGCPTFARWWIRFTFECAKWWGILGRLATAGGYRANY